MNESEITAEFEARSRSARNYREVAALLLIISIVSLVLDGIYRERIGVWGGVILAAGIVLLVLSLTLAMLSFLKLRCPNCSRILGEVFGAAFCPSCGVALKSGVSVGRVSGAGMEMSGGEGGIGAAEKKARAAARSRAARSGKWEPNETPVDRMDYPGEVYPKNIRMFTTSDEMELTKRFIRLIDKDDSAQQASALPQIDTEKKADNSRKSAKK